jgi:UDPglucose 6-dehydrogenase
VALAEAIGYDERIGKKFLRTGIGFGGGCLPEDIRAFMARAEELGVGSAVAFLEDVDQVNLRRRARVVDLLHREFGADLSGKRILVLGAAFKPDSDDLRDSPAIAVSKLIKATGATVVVHDPISLHHVAAQHPEFETEQELLKAAAGADALVLATEWQEYRDVNPAHLAEVVAHKLLIEGRNAVNVERWQQAGWRVLALGRNVEVNA